MLMMFHQKAQKVFQIFNNGREQAKTKECFLVNIVFKRVFTKISIFTLKSDWLKEHSIIKIKLFNFQVKLVKNKLDVY